MSADSGLRPEAWAYLELATRLTERGAELGAVAGQLEAADIDGRQKSYLGSDPAPGVYAVEVVDRDGAMGDVVLRFTDPVPLADLVEGWGPYTAEPPVFFSAPFRSATFTRGASLVIARCDRKPGPDALVMDLLLQPS